MQIALREARSAAREGEVPVGAVAVLDGKLLAQNHNRSLQLNDPTAHAEMLVLRGCGEQLSNYRLNGLDLYVTLEPCAMCAGGLLWARVRRLVFAARDEKAGAVVSQAKLLTPGRFNHTIEVESGVQDEAARRLLRQFFERRRQEKQDGWI